MYPPAQSLRECEAMILEWQLPEHQRTDEYVYGNVQSTKHQHGRHDGDASQYPESLPCLQSLPVEKESPPEGDDCVKDGEHFFPYQYATAEIISKVPAGQAATAPVLVV